mgnify:CR=1 FL=1
MTADERIKNLGYKLVSHNDVTGIFTYENQDNDQRVCLFITKVHWQKKLEGVLCTETISLHENQTMPTGLSFEECRAFLDKADEIRNSMK